MFNIIGAGNMGLAVAGALYELGKEVRIIDIDKDKLERLKTGIWHPEGRMFWNKICYNYFLHWNIQDND